jgi:sterol desaturase/sphingolipid hydroxylase (fatty acid hydroxylase superfamily)
MELGALLTYVATPVFLLAIAAEVAWSKRRRPGAYDLRDALTSLSMGAGYQVLMLGWKLVELAAYAAVFAWSPLDLGTGVWAWIVALVGVDLAYYWYHRLHHEVRVLWASHVVHHSSQRYNLTTALRQTWTPMTALPFYVPLAVVGVRPSLIVTSYALNLVYQFWIHTEAVDRLPRPVEWVLHTPSHHRVHHGTNARYLDRNYGGVLIVWDRLFGTFEAETEPVVYGLTTNIATYHPLRVATHEYAAILADVRRSGSGRVAVQHLVRGPGWRPGAVPVGG